MNMPRAPFLPPSLPPPPLPLLVLMILVVVAGEQPKCENSSLSAGDLFDPYYYVGFALRRERDSHSLIGPFDMSKTFKRKKQSDRMKGAAPPGPEPLQSASRPAASPPLDSAHTMSPATWSGATPQGPGAAPRAGARLEPTSSNKLKGPSKAAPGESPAGRGRAEQVSWPVKRAAVVEGDIVLGGLMMVHGRSESATCGRVMPQGGVQALEAMLYALDAARGFSPPGVRLGAHVLDDCDNDTYGLEMALDFIKGSIGNIEDAQYACDATALRKVISGVVGASSSVTSVQVANLLRLFKIPQVSFFSTSPELSNKARFEYFTRTIPSDLHQVRAMVEIVKRLGWRYVSVVYEESNYGIKAFEELETLLTRNEICIAVKERLVKDSGEADERAYDETVARLLSRPRARGVIVFGSDQEVAGVMAAVARAGATSSFGWVGSDGWSARALVSDGNELAVEGTISVQPRANPVRGFAEYFLNLTVENNPRNPWFVEFWEDQFRCRYPGGAATPYNARYTRPCSGGERLSADNIVFEAQLQFVADAVLAFAHAIRDMHSELCGGKPGLCDEMRPAGGPTLLRYLRRVRFTGLSGDEFHFDGNGDGPARYNILHFKQVMRGEYRWLKVGHYLDGELELDASALRFKWEEPRPPESVCSAECELGQAKQYTEGERCCWHCFNCSRYEIVSERSESCAECERGTLPDAARRSCVPVAERAARPAERVAAAALAALGLAGTAAAAGAWAGRSRTPLVRASGRELSFVLLAGIALCYLVTLALLLRPTDFLCALQRFGTGFSFTVVYAALLTKTSRIARIFAASERSARRPAFISPKSQLAICAALVSVQVSSRPRRECRRRHVPATVPLPAGGGGGDVAAGVAGARGAAPPHSRGQHVGVRLLRGRVLHDRVPVPGRADTHLHRVRRAHPQDTGDFQREQTHRLHDVHDVRHLARIRAAVLRHGASPPAARHQHGHHYLAQRQRYAGLSVRTQDVHHTGASRAQRAREPDAGALAGCGRRGGGRGLRGASGRGAGTPRLRARPLRGPVRTAGAGRARAPRSEARTQARADGRVTAPAPRGARDPLHVTRPAAPAGCRRPRRGAGAAPRERARRGPVIAQAPRCSRVRLNALPDYVKLNCDISR